MSADQQVSTPITKRPRVTGPVPRLVIRHIILTDFKSYGGRQIVGPFHECFSAIVGPNGSGKSNTIDALLFVFGKKAKAIRSHKLSELIHNSDGATPNSAKVEVEFEEVIDDPDKSRRGINAAQNTRQIVENSQLVIGREVFRNNQTKYTVNGKEMSYKTVHNLLLEKGIDLEHNRFLILQGEVEQIAMLKPKAQTENEEGLLEYLEDLIGSNQFITSIDEKTKLLAEASEKKTESFTIAKSAEKDMMNLEGPKNEAQQYVFVATDTFVEQALLSQVERHICRKREAEQKQEVQFSEEQVSKVREEIKTEESKLREIEESVRAKDDQYKKLRDTFDQVKSKQEQFEKEYEKLKAEHKQEKEGREKVDTKVKSSQGFLTKLQNDIKSLEIAEQRANDILTEASKTYEFHHQQYLNNLNKVKDLTAQPTKEKAAAERQLLELNGRMKDVQSKLRHGHQELKDLDEKEQAAKDAKDRQNTEMSKLQAAIQKKEADIKEGEQIIRGCETRSRDSEEEHKQLRSSLQRANIQHHESKVRLDEIRSSFNGQETGGLVGNVMKAVKRGELRGVHGVLKDLCSIDSKYQVALSTALGPQAEHFVVDTPDDARSVVSFVKQNQLGRTTCIILEKTKSFQGANFQPPAPRIIDLIKPAHDRYWNAYSFVLKDSLVVDDIGKATKVAYGERRWRVVTLQGDVIEVSGATSGGGQPQANKNNSRRGSAEAFSESDLRQAETNYANARSALEEIQKKMAEMDQEGHSDTQKNFAEATLVTCRAELKSLKTRLQTIINQNSRVSVSREDTVDSKEALQQSIATLESQLKSLETEISKQEKEVERLGAKIARIGGTELQNSKELSDEAMKERKGRETEHSAHLNTLNKCKTNIAKHQKIVQESEAEIAAIDQKLLNMQAELAKVEKQYMKAVEYINNHKQKLADLNDEVTKLKAGVPAIESKIRELKKRYQERMDDLEKEKEKLRQWHHQIKEHTKNLHSVRKSFEGIATDLLDEEDHKVISEKVEASALGSELPADRLEDIKAIDVQMKFLALESELKKLTPNLGVIEDYRKKRVEYQQKWAQFENAKQLKEDLKVALEEVETQRLNMFMEGYSGIGLELKKMYQMLTLGGDAELELVDPANPFTKGINFSVRPPKKSWKQISNLSGGEKTLSSLALVFALHYFKPTPLYFLDEIDAALDIKNVAIIGNYIKERAGGAQFIIISLRNQMFELSDWVVGVYKTDNITQSLSFNPHCGVSVKRSQPDSRRKENNSQLPQLTFA